MTREAAVTRKLGINTASMGWGVGVKEQGKSWAEPKTAADVKESCKRDGIYFWCTVVARPCHDNK